MDDKRLGRIEGKLDQTNAELAKINITLAAQHVSLVDHIRRTAILESELKPVKTRMDMIVGAIKLITVAGVLVGLIDAIRLFK